MELPAMDSPAALLDLAALDQAPAMREPFDYVIVPGFLRGDAVGAAARDFPRIRRYGSFPLKSLRYGPAFGALIAALTSDDVAARLSQKLGVELTGRPTMATVRGRTGPRDGFIHTDSATKIVTMLVYLNEPWESPGGRLRLLRSASDLDDYAAEVPPERGAMLAFRRSERSYHGHKPFTGERRSLQINWMTGEAVMRREELRHRVSARLKQLSPFS
jgi:SM-20-related protein